MDILELAKIIPSAEPDNFCIAPFVNTRQNEEGSTSPCPFGAGGWRYTDLSKVDRWNAPELNKLRLSFINGDFPDECHRCRDEEKGKKKSLRQLMPTYFPNINSIYNEYIKSGKWVNGPIAVTTKTSNICNLACRSCSGWDTSLLRTEGEHYAEKYNLGPEDEESNYAGMNGIRRFIPRREKAHMEYSGFNKISKNIQKLEFFGGEPFLNKTHIDLLEYLVKTGQSKNCTLFYSTNCMQYPLQRLHKAWGSFKRIELGFSVDGLGDKFEYLRWPGKWDKVRNNIDQILNLPNKYPDTEWFFQGATCFDLFTVFNISETYNWLHDRIGHVYVNTVNAPDVLNVVHAPTHLKEEVVKFHNGKHTDITDYMFINKGSSVTFKQFCIHAKRQDIYRNQDFATTFPRLYEAIKDEYDYYTRDLSEDNFYSNDIYSPTGIYLENN